MGIKSITPTQVLNSRGEPTIKVEMTSETGEVANFVVPGGASVGKNEAVKKFDEGDSYGGKSVNENIQIINTVIAPKFIGYPLDHQEDFDSLLIALDGSRNKENLGSNTILALSGAYFKLSAVISKKPLWQYIAEKLKTSPEFPRIFANIVGGGKHAPGLDIQEFMVVPQTNKPGQAIEQIAQVYQTIRTIMTSLYGPTAKLSGDEGAIAPLGARTEVVLEALYNLGQKSENKFDIALDIAANSFFDGKNYNFEGQSVHASDLMAIYQDWNTKFGIYSMEDPFAETDLEGIELLKTIAKDKKTFMVIGDDFTVTNASKIKEFAEAKIIDGVIIKPDQVGSMSEMLSAVMTAKQLGLKIIVSHRSGETNDDFIVDLSYGIGADGIKIGAPNRGERIAKYNRFLDIESTLGLGINETNQKQAEDEFIQPSKTEVINQAVEPSSALNHPEEAEPNPESNKITPAYQKGANFNSKDYRPNNVESITLNKNNIQEVETSHSEKSSNLGQAAPTPKELPPINDIKINPPANPIPIVPQSGEEKNGTTESQDSGNNSFKPSLSS